MSGTGLRNRSSRSGPGSIKPLKPLKPPRGGLRDSRRRDSGRSRFIAGILVIVAIGLLILGTSSAGVRRGVNDVTHPVQHAAGSVYSSISHSLSSLSNAGHDRRRVEQLTTENANLRRQLADLADTKRVQAALAKLNLVAAAGGYRIVPGRVIAAGEEVGFAHTVTINVGSRQGVRTGLLVLAGQGLAGTTVQVSPDTTVVRLITDGQSHIGARLESSQALGKVDGQGSSSLLFTLYDTSIQIQKGQRLVTFGSLDYAAGVPVGTVTQVTDVPDSSGASGLTREAEVRPYAPLGSLDLVGVIVGKPAVDPGDRVLPPKGSS
jgi:rod shape-determining protein MreC